MKISIASLLATLTGVLLSQGQGTFQNLDFESAQLIYVDPPFNHVIATTNALPGWTAFAGTNQVLTVPYGDQGIYYPVMLFSQTNSGSISGFFSVVLSGGSSAGSISQTGLVAADAQSLVFKVGFLDGPFSLSLGGQSLSFVPISLTPKYTLYGADISAFAGQTATLKFTADGVVTFDDIQFSSSAIPEPSAAALFALSTLALAVRRFRRRRGTP